MTTISKYDAASKVNYSSALTRFEGHLAINLFFQRDLPKDLAIKTARHYFRKVNYAVFGRNAVDRHGAGLDRACFLEVGSTNNWHYHCIIKMPENWKNRAPFCMWMRWQWEELRLAGWNGQFRLINRPAKWAEYISKGMAWGADTLCLETSHFSDVSRRQK